jgi:hypothetical protein
MAGLAARTAAAAGAEVTCVNRTLARARLLADAVGGRAVPLTELGAALTSADVLVTCTGARTLTLTAADLAGTPVRGVVDLALPADVSPDVAEVGITLVNLDRLVVDQHDAASVTEIEAARRLVQGEVSDFLGVRRAAQVAPTVVALRTMASDVVAAELRRLESRLPSLDDHERDEVQRAVRRIVDKLLHAPTVRVRSWPPTPGPGLRRRPAGAVRPRSPDRRRRALPGGPPLVVGVTAPLRLGARTSPLARAQVELVGAALAAHGVPWTFVGVTTRGDVDRRQLAEIGGTGVFVGAVRDACGRGRSTSPCIH